MKTALALLTAFVIAFVIALLAVHGEAAPARAHVKPSEFDLAMNYCLPRVTSVHALMPCMTN